MGGTDRRLCPETRSERERRAAWDWRTRAPQSPRAGSRGGAPRTCEPQGRVFVQRNQRGVEEHGVVVLRHDAVVGGLQPGLMLVGCV